MATIVIGIAVGAHLEDIVIGIKEVDAIPGSFEFIDEEHAFRVIVDFAHTPNTLSRLLDCVRELGPMRVIAGMCFTSCEFSFYRFILVFFGDLFSY